MDCSVEIDVVWASRVVEDIVHLCCKGNNFNSFITEALILCIKVCIKLYIDICGDIYVQYIYIRTCIDHWIKKTIKHKHVIYVFSMMADTYEGHVSRAGCSKLKPLRRDWKSKPRVPQSDRLENAWYMTNTDVRSACVCSDVLAVYIYCICVNIHTVQYIEVISEIWGKPFSYIFQTSGSFKSKGSSPHDTIRHLYALLVKNVRVNLNRYMIRAVWNIVQHSGGADNKLPSWQWHCCPTVLRLTLGCESSSRSDVDAQWCLHVRTAADSSCAVDEQ